MKIIGYVFIFAMTSIKPLIADIPICAYTQHRSLDRESIIVHGTLTPFFYKGTEYTTIEDLAKALNSKKSYRLEISKSLSTHREIKDLIKQMEQAGISIHSIRFSQNNGPLLKPVKKEEFMKWEDN
ncbi:hypothetical protein [Akkermansia glycaniphila]|uniref:hypothetical protein n=1 Tax=Akkermansia glycaniphila TaxID=1679444 RepID=UPI00081DF81B|nr:hypothetical protein [Akkermansia glycaniphila]OCA04234.1 hypothetical protein AC781_00660 [Akkermansia glycaniphila]